MLGRATGGVLVGVRADLVEVEVHLGGGLPAIAAVGLPDAAVREGLERIRAALPHAGFPLPQHRVVVNLAPAEVRKHGTSLDLPMAVALLQAAGAIPAVERSTTLHAGELGLDGSLRPVRGVLSIALAARAAGRRTLVIPKDNAEEAALVEGLDIQPVASLTDAVAVARGMRRNPARTPDRASLFARLGAVAPGVDLGEVRGQAVARRALEIAAAGGHHLLLTGPPGSGKTMLARRLPGILPPLTLEEALEVTRIWSAAGLARELVTARPFRAPHHGVSLAGLTGGGLALRPGEVSLATHGVLYLEELPEFRRDALEALRQPIEDGAITVVRVHASATFPARFQLLASMNPCPCGYHGDAAGRCTCTPVGVRRYLARLSGPLLDRFDLVAEVPPVEIASLSGAASGESSTEVRGRVVAARERQRERFGRGGPACNARMGAAELSRFAVLDRAPARTLSAACRTLGLSARGFDRIRRVARTLADLEGVDRIGEAHVAEAVRYRVVGARGGT